MWVPRCLVFPLTLREEGSQTGSRAKSAPTFTFQARMMPERLAMVRMPWGKGLKGDPQFLTI
jgi:hypothetical protein